ncbi:hypothetical protein NB713_003746 [Xanthomonas sacchari]|nr:hypothetical protein [Xanthomonas sacchari]
MQGQDASQGVPPTTTSPTSPTTPQDPANPDPQQQPPTDQKQQ